MNNQAAVDLILASTLAQLDFLSSPSVAILSPSEISHIQSKLRSSLSGTRSAVSIQSPSPQHPTSIVEPPTFDNLSINDNVQYNQPQQYTQPPPSVNIPGLPPRTIPPPLPQQEKRAVALWDYAGDQADDLRLNKGDVVVITEEVNPQWLKGHLVSQPSIFGLFPSNYVERLPAPPPPPAPNGYQNEKFTQGYDQAQVGPNGYPLQAPPQGYYQQQGQMMPYQQGQVMMPPPQHVQIQGQQQQVATADQGKKNKLFNGDFKSTLAHSAVGGFGFGAGSSVAGHIVNAIL